jgi:hypothetical protein
MNDSHALTSLNPAGASHLEVEAGEEKFPLTRFRMLPARCRIALVAGHTLALPIGEKSKSEIVQALLLA